MTLVDDTYLQILVSNRSFSLLVPRPLFQLYCVTALWYRYLQLSVGFGRREVDNVVHLEQMRSVVWNLPDPIRRYLDGIGEFRAPSGDKFQILSPTYWPTDAAVGGLRGFYGQLTPANIMDYASYPSPGVAAYNVCAAIGRFNNQNMVDLPAAILPAAIAGQTWHVTDNLSGFYPGEALSRKQVVTLNQLGFSNVGNVSRFSANRFGFNGTVTSYVSEAIAELKDFKTSLFSNSNITGTQAIVPYLEIEDSSVDIDTDESYVSSGHEFTVVSSFDLDARLSSGSLLMAYRLEREATDDHHGSFLPYRPLAEDGAALPIPQAFRNLQNVNFARGQSARLNVELFTTRAVNRRDVISEMTRAFVKKG
jgi:hypothetical protein